LIRAMQLPGL